MLVRKFAECNGLWERTVDAEDDEEISVEIER